jgi:hypothetical protein
MRADKAVVPHTSEARQHGGNAVSTSCRHAATPPIMSHTSRTPAAVSAAEALCARMPRTRQERITEGHSKYCTCLRLVAATAQQVDARRRRGRGITAGTDARVRRKALREIRSELRGRHKLEPVRARQRCRLEPV